MDIVLTQDFLPLIGGTYLTLYEVYKRWPTPVILLTQDYSTDQILRTGQASFDSTPHGPLEIRRRDIRIEDISILDWRCIGQYWKILGYLSQIAGRHSPTLHCIDAFPEGIAAVAFKLLCRRNSRILTYAHGEELLVAATSVELKFLAKLVYSLSDIVIVNSRSTDRLVKALCPKANTEIVYRGVDATAFDISEKELRAYRSQWGWPDNTVILVTVSRMEPRKNHSAVIEALADLRKEGLPLAYVIGGGGEEKDSLVAKVKELQLGDWVRFTGYLSDEERVLVYAASDIHVMPSIKIGPMIEGFGIVFLEAAAAGIPSISGNSGGQPEAVLNGQTGLVIDGGNAMELKRAIRSLAENKELRASLGAKGRKWARANDWNTTAAKIHDAVSKHG